ncbi:aminotransferase class IV [Merismopedia glauca]|uniref:4-amino-4-deoxychorismate lyase n=1 Tax=Merismopedia glauca CCAP 1448/3 TaxID=1296344 RepID=A0A2T1C0Q0_9CYAN|nr:aminotransferase class IV [Merismopedia glauca]PSB01840.1 4-amino-4-deoxychorismate lyase [Merismopedia glauca CCAP 1448/3]
MFWYNGQIIADNKLEIRSDDPALLYGASAFTTIRIYHDSLKHPLTSWLAHYHRLSQTIGALEWEVPDWERVKQGVKVLLSKYSVIRVAIFPDGREFISGRELPENLSSRQSNGIKAWLVEESCSQRTLAVYKTGNYLTSWLALNRAQKLGAQEAILVDGQSNWLETSTGNLWGWRDGQWWTPSLNGKILPGIRRTQLREWLSEHNIPVGEVIWEPSFVAGLEALAYTNCVVEVIPIHTISGSHSSSTYPVNHPGLAQLRSFFLTIGCAQVKPFMP